MEKLNEVDKKEELIKIDQFDEIGWYYDYLMGDKKVKLCECCGKLIKIKSAKDNSTKYCEECKYVIKLEQNRKYYNEKQ